jgi:hypothetical protein
MSKTITTPGKVGMKNIKYIRPDWVAPTNELWQTWKKRIMIAVPTTGLVRIEWVMARFGQIIPCNWSNGDIFQYFDQFSPLGWAVAEARNICVKHFIEQGHEWLFFIDHDVVLPPVTFLKIGEYIRKGDVPIVSGLYYCKSSHPEPLLFRGRGTGYYDKWKPGDKVWVDGIPMGCTLIHRSIIQRLWDTSPEEVARGLGGQQIVTRKVFETPREAWFDPEAQQYFTKVGTEDLFWCERIMKEKVFEKCGVKAYAKYQKKKFPFLLDTTISCKHIDENGRQYP